MLDELLELLQVLGQLVHPYPISCLSTNLTV